MSVKGNSVYRTIGLPDLECPERPACALASERMARLRRVRSLVCGDRNIAVWPVSPDEKHSPPQ